VRAAITYRENVRMLSRQREHAATDMLTGLATGAG
jgi:hypothetical protein